MGLFKKSSDPVKTPPQKKTGKRKDSISGWHYQLILIPILAGLACWAALQYVYLEQQSIQTANEKSLSHNNALASVIDAYNENRQKTIALAINTLIKPSALFSSLDARKLEAFLQARYQEFVSLSVIEGQDVNTFKKVQPDASFATIDLFRRLISGEKPTIESFNHNKEWLLQVGAPIGPTDKPIGYAIVTLNTTEIARHMKIAAVASGGLFVLRASNAPVAQAILQSGQANGTFTSKKVLKTSAWQLEHRPLILQKNMDVLIMLIVGIVSLLTGIILFILARVNSKNIRADIEWFENRVVKIVRGSSKQYGTARFSEFQSAASNTEDACREQLAKINDKQHIHKPSNIIKNQDEALDDEYPLFEDDSLDLDLLEDANDAAEVNEETPFQEIENMIQQTENPAAPQSIFRAYDIRGIVNETLTEENVEKIGKAFASEALTEGQKQVCVGYDGRLSSIPYCQALTRGIASTGAQAIVIGLVPTPVLYFATHHLNTGTGVMITGSHNPGNYNGFKMMIGGRTLANDDIQSIYQRICSDNYIEGSGHVIEQSVSEAYIDTIVNDLAVATPLKVVVDAGNGVAGELAPRLIEELGCDVIPLFCEIDGNFPNHHPDPGKPKNLQDLIASVKEHNADIGLAFDGDGDRVGVVTNTGKIIWPDRLLMLFAKDVVERNPGADVIFDVKCSRRLNSLISGYGGRPVMWKTGHSLIKAKMKETGALLAGEMSGHIFFKERWLGFDDGLYSAARLLEILGAQDRSAEDVFADFPEDVSTPEINIEVTEESKFTIVDALLERKNNFGDGNVSNIDGLRVDYENGWGLCRASNTTPMLVLRFEADDEAALEQIKNSFKEQLTAVDSSLDLSF